MKMQALLLIFKWNYGRIYQVLFSGVRLLRQGTLSRNEDWDDIAYWVLEKV